MQTHVTSNLSEMDVDLVYDFISNSYWSKGIPRAIFDKAIENSLCFGLMQDAKGCQATKQSRTTQIGFARMITDRSSFAYLADVFIVEEYRGRGLSAVLLNAVFTHSDMQGLRRIILATKDAHGVYEKYGFTSLDDPARLMHKHTPDIYQQ